MYVCVSPFIFSLMMEGALELFVAAVSLVGIVP